MRGHHPLPLSHLYSRVYFTRFAQSKITVYKWEAGWEAYYYVP